MRLKATLFACGLLLIGCLAFLTAMRNRYSLVPYSELLTIRKKLQVLSPQEKRDLAFFINQAVSWDYYPYTLIGYKPMSMTCVIVEDTEDLLPCWRKTFNRPRIQMLRRGYLVWEKYQSLFARNKHLFVDYSFMGKGRREIALIDPKLCMTTIQEHLDDFQMILGKPSTSEEVFAILTHLEHNDFYTIIDHSRLFGILLGFGRNNAYLYEQHRGVASRSNTQHHPSNQCTTSFH